MKIQEQINKIEELHSLLCGLDNTIFYRERAKGAERAEYIKQTDAVKNHIEKLFKQYAEHIRKQTIEEMYEEMTNVVHANNLDITPKALKQLYRDMEHWKNKLLGHSQMETRSFTPPKPWSSDVMDNVIKDLDIEEIKGKCNPQQLSDSDK